MRLTQLDSRPEWVEPEPIPRDPAWRSLDANPLVAAVLYRRGIRTAEDADAFMHPDRQPAPDPYRIPNMERGVRRIEQAIRTRERIGIFGDYDVDGVTSTALLAGALRAALGDDQVVTRLPERHEGYGLNADAVEEFRASGVSLVVAVDCGSTDHVHATQIADAAMDLVILDHHQMADGGPESAITISPQLNGDGTYHDLTAVGVAYLLVCALAETGIPVASGPGNIPAQYLDLVALGTVADVAPLVGVNRLLVHKGLDLLRSGRRPGIAALLQAAGQEPSAVTASTVSFALAPRLNSAGRIGSPTLAFDLLLSRNRRHADTLARALEELNAKRRMRSAQVLAEAYAAVSRQPGWESRSVLAAHNPGWESGVVGAVASRMAEETRRPVFLFRNADGVLSGSARSVEGFNLVSSLAGIAEILLTYGGHSLAAGVSIREEHLPRLESHLAEAMRRQEIAIPAPRLVRIDANLPPNCISLQTARDLSRMEPFGRGNEQPLLRIRDAGLVKYSTMGKEREHLKIVVQAGGRQVEAIAWRGANRSKELVMRRRIDLVGRLEINAWNGQERLQMVIEDFRAE